MDIITPGIQEDQSQRITAREVAEITGGTLHEGVPGTVRIQHLLTDSRNIASAEHALFFAIRGDRRDGHEFVDELIDQGVRYFVVSDEKVAENKNACFIVVPDTLQALQRLAAWHRSRFSFPVVGITGSNGKTIVKEWLHQLMQEDKHIVRSPKSYNSQIGVPLSVWQMQPANDLALFEAGISRPGEMGRLEPIIRPTIGIFTNIGQAHNENFNSTDEKIAEKMQLFKGVSTLVYCRDYADIESQVSAFTFEKEVKHFTWSRKSKADLQIGRIHKEGSETEIQGIHENNFMRIRIPFSDDASVENAILCWAAMLVLGYDLGLVAARFEKLSPVAMRLEMKAGINNCAIINDSYNSDLGSLAIALDFLDQQKQHKKKTLILSDILQSGKQEKELYAAVSRLLSGKDIHRLVGIGESISRQAGVFDTDTVFYPSTSEFLRQFHPATFQDEIILIKGARKFGFEKISNALQQKAHETVLEINLNALVHNLNYYRARLKAETKIMCMVKAFAYGSGSTEIASTLQFQGVDYLTVAYADEGVELRKAGITLPVMVMNPEAQSFNTMIAYNLEPEIYSFRILNRFSEAIRQQAGLPGDRQLPVHIKLETGMNRLGFEERAIPKMIVQIKNNKRLRVASVFSHLAGSDEGSLDRFTKQQVERFTRACQEIRSHFDYPIDRHILNSAGIIRFPEAQFEMVRLGIGLHGIAATASEQNHLQMVSSLKTTISQIRHISAGDTVGYNRVGKAERDMDIAVVGIGYADGLSRRLGNGKGKMFVHGKPVPVFGNVCMDMTMLDITSIPAREGDEVTVFGNEYSIMDMARDLDTIPYEVLTGVSERVKRVYYHE